LSVLSTDSSHLARARATVVGMGALGCRVSSALARAGVGELTLVDFDRVELSNLQRQPLYRPDCVGLPKAIVAAEALRKEAASTTAISGAEERLDGANAKRLLGDRDVVIDATDDPATKLLLNHECIRAGVPLVHGGVVRTGGVAMAIVPGATACLACTFAPESTFADDGCAAFGILAPVAGVVGSIQGFLALSLLLGARRVAGRLYAYELRATRWRTMRVPRDPNCTVCGTIGTCAA
jgi:molybdopterin/thiamine biosynthesis adenylyltransferase